MSSNSPLKGHGQTTFLGNNFIETLSKLQFVETNVVVTAYVDIMISSIDRAFELAIDGVEGHCPLLHAFEASCHFDID